MSTAVLLVLAALLVLIGRWGRRNAESLAPRGMPERERAQRAGVLRRGGIACHVVACLLATAGVLSAF
jgi:ABC-type Fe3+ transport system permease subunit